jgi:hypothetical protein
MIVRDVFCNNHGAIHKTAQVLPRPFGHLQKKHSLVRLPHKNIPMRFSNLQAYASPLLQHDWLRALQCCAHQSTEINVIELF